MMNKESKIWELPDGEFLNFLYNERNREYSKHYKWGVNFWIASGSIIALLAYTYHAISVDYYAFDWRLVAYYCVVLGMIMAIGTNIALPAFANERWTNKVLIATRLHNAPIVALNGKIMIIGISLSFLMIYNDFGIAFFSLLFLLFLENIIKIYIHISRNKLVKFPQRRVVFSNKILNFTYCVIEIISFFLVIIFAISTCVNHDAFGIRELEISCVVVIICGIFWLMYFRLHNTRYITIDWWIEQYLFGSLSKQEVYIYLLEYSQGSDMIDVIYNDYKKLRPIIREIKERKEKYDKYKELIDNDQLCDKDIIQYYTYVVMGIKESQKIVKTVKKVNDNIQKYLMLPINTYSIHLYEKIYKDVLNDMDIILNYSDDCYQIHKELTRYIAACKKNTFRLTFYNKLRLQLLLYTSIMFNKKYHN